MKQVFQKIQPSLLIEKAHHCLDAITYPRWSVLKKWKKSELVNIDLREMLKDQWTITTKFQTQTKGIPPRYDPKESSETWTLPQWNCPAK